MFPHRRFPPCFQRAKHTFTYLAAELVSLLTTRVRARFSALNLSFSAFSFCNCYKTNTIITSATNEDYSVDRLRDFTKWHINVWDDIQNALFVFVQRWSTSTKESLQTLLVTRYDNSEIMIAATTQSQCQQYYVV